MEASRPTAAKEKKRKKGPSFFHFRESSQTSEQRLEEAVRIYARGPLHLGSEPQYKSYLSGTSKTTALSGGYSTPFEAFKKRRHKVAAEAAVYAAQKQKKPPIFLVGNAHHKPTPPPAQTHQKKRRPHHRTQKGPRSPAGSATTSSSKNSRPPVEDSVALEKFMSAMDAKLEATLQDVHDQLRASDDERREQLERLYREEMRKAESSPEVVASLKLMLEDAQSLIRQQQATADQAAVTIQEQRRRRDEEARELKEREAASHAAFAALEAALARSEAQFEEALRQRTAELELAATRKSVMLEANMEAFEANARLREEAKKQADRAAAKVKILEAHAVRADGLHPSFGGDAVSQRRRSRSGSVGSLPPLEENDATSPRDDASLKWQLEEKTRQVEALLAEEVANASLRAAAVEARDHAIDQAASLQCQVTALTDELARARRGSMSRKTSFRLPDDDQAGDDSSPSTKKKKTSVVYSRDLLLTSSASTIVHGDRGQMARARRMSPAQIVVDEVDLLKAAEVNEVLTSDNHKTADDTHHNVARLQAAQRGRAARRKVAQRHAVSALPDYLRHDDAVLKNQTKAARLIQSHHRGNMSRRRSSSITSVPQVAFATIHESITEARASCDTLPRSSVGDDPPCHT